MAQGVLSKVLHIPSRRINFFGALLISAFLWFLSLPPYGISVLAVIAFTIPLIFLQDAELRKIIFYAPIFTTIFEFSSYWWIAPVISKYGAIPFSVALILTLLLSFYLGMYLFFFYAGMKIFIKKYGVSGLVFAPFLYVVIEWLKGRVFGGFPWWGLGYSLSMNDYILQSARFFGIYGLSFLAMMVSVSLCFLIISRREIFTLIFSSITIVLLLFSFVDGYFYCRKNIEKGDTLVAGFIQPNIPQDRKWNPQFRSEIMRRMEDLSFSLEKECLDVLVMPESSTPVEWGYDKEYDEKMVKIAKQTNSNFIFGTVFEDEKGIYNGAIILNRKGDKIGDYKKTHLVPFGEYVPMQKTLSFLSPIVETVGNFESGNDLKPINIEGKSVGITICYETIFPNLVRKQVNLGAQVLVNLSNDAWYVGTPALMQHFLIDRVRCVENKRYLVRSANGGVSATVNFNGKIESLAEINKPSASFGEVKLISEKTFYAKWGDFYILIFVIVLFGGFISKEVK
jgi:apolipoprotein N-acyltransferase